MLKRVIERCMSSRFVVNTSWIMIDRIYQMVVSLIVGLLTARYLGPANFGIINYVAAFISFAIPICSLGFEGVIVKKIVDKPEREGEIIGTAMVMEFGVSIISSLIIVGIVAVSNAGDQVKIIVAVLESVRLLFKSSEPIEFWYQSKMNSKYASIIKMIAYTVMTVYRVMLLVTDKTVEWFAFATSLDMIVIAVLYIFMYKKQGVYRLQFNLAIGKEMLHESYHFILSGVMIVVYSQMDKVMIQYMLGETEVGLYSAASTISNLWFLVPAALITSARPLIMQAKGVGEGIYLKRIKQLYAAIFWMGIAVGVATSLFSRPIMYILYGIDYMAACSTLVIGVWYGVFAELGSARGIWILCEGKNRYTKLILVWGLITNLILNWLLIPVMGIEGAAVATLATQIVTCIIAPLFYRETRIHTAILLQSISLSWIRKK